MRCQHCSYSLHLCACMRAAEGLWCAMRAFQFACSLVGRTRFMSFCPINCFACRARHAELLMLSDQFSQHICRLMRSKSQFISAIHVRCIVLALVSLCALHFLYVLGIIWKSSGLQFAASDSAQIWYNRNPRNKCWFVHSWDVWTCPLTSTNSVNT